MLCLRGRVPVPTTKSVFVIVRHSFSKITVLKWHSIINRDFVLWNSTTRPSGHCNLERKSCTQGTCRYLYNPTRFGIRNSVANRWCRRQRLLGHKVGMRFITYSLQWKQYRLAFVWFAERPQEGVSDEDKEHRALQWRKRKFGKSHIYIYIYTYICKQKEYVFCIT
jgi:hypothetical protein